MYLVQCLSFVAPNSIDLKVNRCVSKGCPETKLTTRSGSSNISGSYTKVAPREVLFLGDGIPLLLFWLTKVLLYVVGHAWPGA
jgi:hypothetical protein